MRTTTQLIQRHRGYGVWELGMDRVMEATPFVFGVYYERFHAEHGWLGEEYEQFEAADLATLPRSKVYFAATYEGTPLASMRMIERGGDPLPLEHDLGIDVLAACARRRIRPRRVMEIARLAKCERAITEAGLPPQLGLKMVDDIIAHTVRTTCEDPRNVWVASIDDQVLRLLRARGFKFAAIGPSVDYLGSPTTPVMLSVGKLRADMRRMGDELYQHYFGAPAATDAA